MLLLFLTGHLFLCAFYWLSIYLSIYPSIRPLCLCLAFVSHNDSTNRSSIRYRSALLPCVLILGSGIRVWRLLSFLYHFWKNVTFCHLFQIFCSFHCILRHSAHTDWHKKKGFLDSAYHSTVLLFRNTRHCIQVTEFVIISAISKSKLYGWHTVAYCGVFT